MRAHRLALVALLLGFVAPIGVRASAATLGDATVGFAAERVLIINGHSYIGKMWHMPGVQRHEQALPALKPVFILRAGSDVGDIVLPQLHTVVEFSLPKEFSLLDAPAMLRNPVAQETINGVATTKYAVDEDTPAGRATGSLWLSREGIPMKCDATFTGVKGKPSSIFWELRHVKVGRQQATLFEVPAGYAKLSPEAAAPLLGMRLARP